MGTGLSLLGRRGAAAAGRQTKIKGRDSERTKELILLQATREFSAKGFDGARVDNIAARCHLSKNSLYYHFKSKNGLIMAVLENMYLQLRQRQEVPAEPVEDVREEIQHIINLTFRAFVEMPEIIRLLNEENLHKGIHIRKSKSVQNMYNPLVERLEVALKRGEQEKVFRAGLDPIEIYLTLSSLAYHYLSNSYTLGFAFDRDLLSPKALERWGRHINAVILTFCQVPGPASDNPAKKTASTL